VPNGLALFPQDVGSDQALSTGTRHDIRLRDRGFVAIPTIHDPDYGDEFSPSSYRHGNLTTAGMWENQEREWTRGANSERVTGRCAVLRS